MLNKIKRLLLIAKIKWIQNQCTRLCVLCKYRNECWENFDLEHGYKKGDK